MHTILLFLSISNFSPEFIFVDDSSYYTYYKIEDSVVTENTYRAFEDSLEVIKGSFRSKRALDGGGVSSHKMKDKFGVIYLVTIITDEKHVSYSIKRMKEK